MTRMTPASEPKILPKAGERNVLITSALPYVNNVPHLGNIIGSVLSADVFARYCRARGLNTLYVCGTDEYGTTTETKAIAEKVTPQALCDRFHAVHAQVYQWFNISFDVFGRTTTKQQTTITHDIFLGLHKNGLLHEKTTTQLYCDQHQAFLADRFVEGVCPICGSQGARGDQCDYCGVILDPLDLIRPRCVLDRSTPRQRDTKHIFFNLDKLQPEIETFVQSSHRKGAWSSNGKEITSAWLQSGLLPRSITRDLRWGTTVPLEGYENKVIYPWFDACIGYISITAGYTDDWRQWWCNPSDVQLHQFIGKDNVVFHSVMFPASLIGTRETWTKLHHLSTTDYLTYEQDKFSKSRGIGVFGDSAQKTGIASDIWRFYLLSHRPEHGDTEFNWESFIDCNNNLLLKNLGNFVNRVVKFLNTARYGGIVPDYTLYTDPGVDRWKGEINQLLTQYIHDLDAVKLRPAVFTVLAISQSGNAFLQANGFDNKLAIGDPIKCAGILGHAVNLIHLLAILVSPYMPDTAACILEQLNVPPFLIPDVWTASTIQPGHTVGAARLLFSHIKEDNAQVWRQSFGGDESREYREAQIAQKAEKKVAKTNRRAAAPSDVIQPHKAETSIGTS